jgi:hypothetical protein
MIDRKERQHVQQKSSGAGPAPEQETGRDGETGSSGKAPGENAPFLPPEGWTRSANRSTSRFAFEMSNTTRYYTNDGRGTGYFAPGWNAERLARKTGIFRHIALVLAALIVAGSAFWIQHAYDTQDDYAWLEAKGVATTAVVGDVTVEHETDRYHYRNSSSGWDYITTTTAQISYAAQGGGAEGTIEETRTQKKSFPDPEWSSGESVRLYVDPQDAAHFVLFDETRERDLSEGTPLEVKIALVVTAVLLILPLFLYLAGRRNVREARKL